MNIPKTDELIKISHMLKNGMITCGISAILSILFLALGFQLNWVIPAFYIVFCITFSLSITGVVVFGTFYFIKNGTKGKRRHIEELKDKDILLLDLQVQLQKIKGEKNEKV